MSAFRNNDYLAWVRTRFCCVCGKVAEVAHHVRLGDHVSGVGIKPSDYRVIPLINYYHTVSSQSVHRMGEQSFYQYYGLKIEMLIINLLQEYLLECYQLRFSFMPGLKPNEKICLLEEAIEMQRQDKGREQRQREAINSRARKEQKELRDRIKLERAEEHQQELRKAREFQKKRRQQQSKIQVDSSFQEQQKEKARLWRKERYQKLKEWRKSLT